MSDGNIHSEMMRVMSELSDLVEHLRASHQPLPPALRPVNTDVQVPANADQQRLSGPERIYMTHEAAPLLGMKPRTVEAWCRADKIKATKPAGKYLITEAEILRVRLLGSSRRPPQRATPSVADETARLMQQLQER